MGLGFYGRRRTRGFFDTMLGHFIDAGIVDDPLLLFELGGLGKCRDPHGETVNLSALFTCQAAVCEALEPGDLAASLAARMQACESVGLIAADVGWYPEPLDRDFHSAILLVRPRVGSLILSNTTMLRTSLREHGIGATVYNDGLVRLSFSESFPSAAETDKIRRALQVVA